MNPPSTKDGTFPRVLVISDLYPRLLRPVFGVFIEEQTIAAQQYCEQVVVSPIRVFPPLSVFRNFPSVSRFRTAWQSWQDDVDKTPDKSIRQGVPVYYPRYYSPPKNPTYGFWGWFAYPLALPLLRRLHAEKPFDLIHAHYPAPAGTMALLAKRWLKVPVVVSEHGLGMTVIARQNPISRAYVKQVYQQADAVIVYSQRSEQVVIENGADPERVHRIYYGINSTEVASGVRPPHSPDTPLQLLTVARLVKHKGVQWVLHALRRLLDEDFNLEYTIGGDGDYRPELESLVQTLGLTEKVRFIGTVLRPDIPTQFSASDIFVLPSDPEPFGIVYIEALGQGKPIVACDCSGATDIRSFYPDGVELLKSQNVDELTEALRRLIQDPARRQRVQQGGPRLVAERFTWDRTAQETVALYRNLLNHHELRGDATGVHP